MLRYDDLEAPAFFYVLPRSTAALPDRTMIEEFGAIYTVNAACIYAAQMSVD